MSEQNENRPSDAEAVRKEFGGSTYQNTPGGIGEARAGTARRKDSKAGSVRMTIERICGDVTVNYLSEIAGREVPLAAIRDELIKRIEAEVFLENGSRPKGWARPCEA